jgi:hypothetical protein
MRLNRRTLQITLGVLVAYLGWQNLSFANSEVVVLRTFGTGHVEHYASLWMIEDGRHLWVRADNRERRWLRHVRANPQIELSRDGQTRSYLATFFDYPDAREYVDSRFRQKYGFADWVRALTEDRDTLPIRLERIDR